MLEFIQLLKQRYQAIQATLDSKNPLFFDYQQTIEQLLYAEAFIRKGQLIESLPQFPLQIAVIGPTQAGKSSVVNLLTQSQQAGVSPLAGYTVHPHGYSHQLNANPSDEIQRYFGRFQLLAEPSLANTRYDCFSLTDIQTKSSFLPECVIWDTPDFDSIDAIDYREGLIRTIGLADIIILVVSKEKYADLSVWEIMQTIAPFKQPSLICLNKLTEESESLVINSLKQKWLQHRTDPIPEIISLQFQKQYGAPVWPFDKSPIIPKLAQQINHKQHQQKQQNLLNHYWAKWLTPIQAEHQALHTWQNLVDETIKQAITQYQRDFLDHPHYYETFQNAILKLLKLLEIPGIAKALSKSRRVLTWPMRKLIGIGSGKSALNQSQELTVLFQIGEHVLIQLADKLLEKTENPTEPLSWWQDTAISLRTHKPQILQNYQLAVADYQDHFKPNVDAAAHRLYNKLQEQPVTLNSLRATRISTDAAAIILAIQTGGIGVHDFVLTPMMLSITSLLAESAIGSYMRRVEAELKQQQLNLVKKSLFEDYLRDKLHTLPTLSASKQRFNITQEQCHTAERQLKEKKHGLRLL